MALDFNLDKSGHKADARNYNSSINWHKGSVLIENQIHGDGFQSIYSAG